MRGSGALVQALGSAAQRFTGERWPFLFGVIDSYDPATHSAVIRYDRLDHDGSKVEHRTAPAPICTGFWGQGYGRQSAPPIGVQCLAALLDPQGEECVIVAYTANDHEPGLGTPSDEEWTLDARGSYHKFTADGGTAGDGLGGVKSHAASYHETTTAKGHAQILDDNGRIISTQTADGLWHRMDDTTQTVATQAGSAQSVVDGKRAQVSHIGKVGLGDFAHLIPASQVALHRDHIKSLVSSIMSDMMQSFSKQYAMAMTSASIPNSPAFLAIVQASGWVTGNVTAPTIPTGAPNVLIASS